MAFYLMLHSPTKFLGYHDIAGLTKPAFDEIWQNIRNNKTGVRPVIFNQCRDSGQNLVYAVYNHSDFVLFGLYLNVTKLAQKGLIDENFSHTIRKDQETEMEAFIGVVYPRGTETGLEPQDQIIVTKDFFLGRYNEMMESFWEIEKENLQQRFVKFKIRTVRGGNYQYISADGKCINKSKLQQYFKRLETKRCFPIAKKYEEPIFDTMVNMAIKGGFDEEFLYLSGRWDTPEKYLNLKGRNLKVIFSERRDKLFTLPPFVSRFRKG